MNEKRGESEVLEGKNMFKKYLSLIAWLNGTLLAVLDDQYFFAWISSHLVQTRGGSSLID